MSGHSIKWWDLPEEKTILIQKRSILKLLSAPGGYMKRKLSNIYIKLVKKELKRIVKVPNILENEINNAGKLKKSQ